MSARMQPEYNREVQKQIGPSYNPSGSSKPVDPLLVTPGRYGAEMEGNFYSSRQAAIYENEEARQENAVRSLPAGDADTDINSAYALRKTSVSESKEADAP